MIGPDYDRNKETQVDLAKIDINQEIIDFKYWENLRPFVSIYDD